MQQPAPDPVAGEQEMGPFSALSSLSSGWDVYLERRDRQEILVGMCEYLATKKKKWDRGPPTIFVPFIVRRINGCYDLGVRLKGIRGINFIVGVELKGLVSDLI